MGASRGQTVKQNKFQRYFSADLTSIQARGIYFILCENLDEKEMEELDEAYYPISRIIRRRELRNLDTMI